MLGILRNGFRFSNIPANFSKLSQVSASANGAFGKSTCQQCSSTLNSTMIIPNWLQSSSTRCFGTLRALINPTAWKLGNINSSAFLQRGIPVQEIWDAPEASMTNSSSGGYYVPVRGMKYKGRVKRRCKDCFLMYVNGMLYNLCKTHPRHKAGLKPPYFVNQRILTHAMSTPKRPW